MPIKRHHLALLGVSGLAIFGATACNLSIDLGPDGSGTAETNTYEFDDFTEVDISNAFVADISVVEGPPSIEVTLDDNLFEHLEIDVDGDELKIEMGPNSVTHRVEPRVVITMPELTELDVSGASSATVSGVEGNGLKINLSGASNVEIDSDVERLEVGASGASNVVYSGSAGSVKADASGASLIDFSDATVNDATVDASGASNIEFSDLDQLVGDASGASTIVIPESTSASLETSGLGGIERK